MNIKYPDSVSRLAPVSDPPPEDPNGEKTASNLEELAIKEGEQNLGERKKYAKYTFIFVSVWTGAIIVIGFFQGFSVCSFELSDPILGTLMGGTMVKVLGTFYIILSYLFPVKKKNDKN